MTIGLLSIVGVAHEPCHLNTSTSQHLDKLGVLIFNFPFLIASLRSASRFARVSIPNS